MCINNASLMSPRRKHQAGISFVELIMFIIVVSAGIAGILAVINFNTARSADPMIQKQALAIAESLLEEIGMQPFTYCDPDDEAVETATSAVSGGGCTTIEAPGPEAMEARTNVDAPFDNVNDYVTAYGAEVEVPIIDVVGNIAISGLENYRAWVKITQQGIKTVPDTESLRIDVRVTGPAGVEVRLTGYRLRYAPNSA